VVVQLLEQVPQWLSVLSGTQVVPLQVLSPAGQADEQTRASWQV
jgi:hypothetical protein